MRRILCLSEKNFTPEEQRSRSLSRRRAAARRRFGMAGQEIIAGAVCSSGGDGASTQRANTGFALRARLKALSNHSRGRLCHMGIEAQAGYLRPNEPTPGSLSTPPAAVHQFSYHFRFFIDSEEKVRL